MARHALGMAVEIDKAELKRSAGSFLRPKLAE